jgi:hypothetical protein
MRALARRPSTSLVVPALALAAPLGLALAACSDPALSIALTYADGEDALIAHVEGDPGVQLRVRAIDALAAARAATWPRAPRTAAGAPATCDELSQARIPPDVLDTSTLATGGEGGRWPAYPGWAPS